MAIEGDLDVGAVAPRHRDQAELAAGLAEVRRAPSALGRVELVVRRPEVGGRELLALGQLSQSEGLVGDNWASRGSSSTPDGSAHPDRQVTLMSSRAAALVAGEREHWPLAGDQLYLDFDLSEQNLPAGTRLRIGEAVVEVTAEPHRGCKKFTDRFGKYALRLVNSPEGVALRLRGANARVVVDGAVRPGDRVAIDAALADDAGGAGGAGTTVGEPPAEVG